MIRVAAIATACCLIPLADSDASARAQRSTQMTVWVGVVSACGASTPGVAPSADPVVLLGATRVTCESTVPYRIEVLAAEPKTLTHIVSVEF